MPMNTPADLTRPDHSPMTVKTTVRVGADRLLTDASGLIAGKRVCLLTNHTGLLSDGEPLADAILRSGIARLIALFGPEHGISGDIPDGNAVEHARHAGHDIPVYSLYGKTHKPTASMFGNADVLVCDIQDVGARFYTYVSTIALAIEAAAEHGIPVIVLDRPNIIRGVGCDGPVRVPQLKSFVGLLPIPVMYGMTIGELMLMFNREGWASGGVRANLEVVPLDGWKRSMWYDRTTLPWVPPSPNLPRLSTAVVYPGMCFLEGTTISEGRGTGCPFECVGAPWADPERVLSHLADIAVAGAEFSAEEFTPRTIPGAASSPKFEGEVCRGIRIHVRNRDILRPVRLGIAVLAAFKRAHPAEVEMRNRRFDILTGNSAVRKMLDDNADPAGIADSWADGLSEFVRLRERYLIYG